jgi:ABC-type multidrug transport system fused ATPase/permease subunit
MRTQSELSDIRLIIRNILSKSDRFKLKILVFASIGISFFDLLGVGILGLVGAITISGIQGSESPALANKLLSLISLEGETFQVQVASLASIATILLISKTIISLYLSKRMFFFFAARSADLSSRILSQIFEEGFESVKTKTKQQIIYTTTAGCDILMIGAVAQSINLIADFALLLIVGVGIIVVQPMTALSSFMIFGLATFVMHKKINVKARELGSVGSRRNIEANRLIDNLFTTFRETYVQNSSSIHIENIREQRKLAAENQAKVTFLPLLNKYFLESVLIFGALIISGIQFLLQDAYAAIIGLTLFLAVGSRLVPALLRVQQGLLNVRNSIGGAEKTILQIKSLKSNVPLNQPPLSIEKEAFDPTIELKNVNFEYKDSSRKILVDISLTISAKNIVAFTGSSGSGKTTLVDLILGILRPTSGEILVSGTNPVQAIRKWSGSISYVPQEVFLHSGTLLSNIAPAVKEREINVDKVIEVCEIAQLTNLISTLPEGLNTLIGTPGITLSGGEKQRVGIARALYTDPKLIVLDEPTSALDVETEGLVVEAVRKMREKATVIIIAHRLSTLENVDTVFYIENGIIKAKGTLMEVRKEIPRFDSNFRYDQKDSS